MTAHKLPLFYEVDFMLVDEIGDIGWWEIKFRDMRWGQYPTLSISLHKIVAGRRLAAISRRAFNLCIACKDGKVAHWRMPVGLIAETIEWCGNRKRADGQDDEPMVHIPNECFLVLDDVTALGLTEADYQRWLQEQKRKRAVVARGDFTGRGLISRG